MKKRIIISLICEFLICCLGVYTFAITGIVKTDNLRLRKDSSTSSEIVTLLSIGDKVEIIEKTDNGWYKVKYKEYEGYVSGDYINAEEGKIETPKQVTQEPEIPVSTTPEIQPEVNVVNDEPQPEQPKITDGSTRNISKGEKIYGIPLINASTVTIVENDSIANVLTQVNGWSYVKSDFYNGWIRTNNQTSTNNSNNNIKNENTSNNEQNNNSQTTEKEQIGYISGTEVNFRKEPSTNGEIISTLTLNREVIIIEKVNGWVKVKVGNDIGYVSATYISNTKVTTTSRSADSRKIQNTHAVNITEEKISENPNGTEIVAYAKQYLGCKYVYGGTTPSGFDCSGFTQYIYNHFGYSINRTSSSQANNGTSVSKNNLQPGDLICFSNSAGSNVIGHVGIFIGNGQFIHAANSRRGVIISNVDGAGFYYVCSRRII